MYLVGKSIKILHRWLLRDTFEQNLISLQGMLVRKDCIYYEHPPYTNTTINYHQVTGLYGITLILKNTMVYKILTLGKSSQRPNTSAYYHSVVKLYLPWLYLLSKRMVMETQFERNTELWLWETLILTTGQNRIALLRFYHRLNYDYWLVLLQM